MLQYNKNLHLDREKIQTTLVYEIWNELIYFGLDGIYSWREFKLAWVIKV
jgi:hypothetical protein